MRVMPSVDGPEVGADIPVEVVTLESVGVRRHRVENKVTEGFTVVDFKESAGTDREERAFRSETKGAPGVRTTEAKAEESQAYYY